MFQGAFSAVGEETINRGELAICKRRGHDVVLIGIGQRWKQCKWCGIWLREVRTIEEREDDPPNDEQDPLGRISR